MTERRSGKQAHEAIDRFFDRELMPLARELKSRGVSFLETSPMPQAPSYYVSRMLPEMRPEDFEWGGADSPNHLEGALVEMWKDPNWQPLAALAPSMARLAQRLRRVEDQPGEVSEFVYVMY